MLGLTQYTSGGSTWASGRSWLEAEAHQHIFQRKLWKYIVSMCVCQGSSASQRLCALCAAPALAPQHAHQAL